MYRDLNRSIAGTSMDHLKIAMAVMYIYPSLYCGKKFMIAAILCLTPLIPPQYLISYQFYFLFMLSTLFIIMLTHNNVM
jgi:hypothetical protein